MRATRQLQYAIYGIFDLAYNGGARPVRVREIGERQDIPARYLEQIFQRLRRAGLVASKRGPGGGYTLARPAGEILLAEVIVAVEGSVLAASDAAGTGSASPEFVWDWLRRSLSGALEEITIASLCREAARRGLRRVDAEPPMYEI
ncbi:MAG: Rrf2 family transcriptional regulator [Myxococcales bacterium]|nr:Rrf2 family transcriptional regulator [Myxococcales bacterium]